MQILRRKLVFYAHILVALAPPLCKLFLLHFSFCYCFHFHTLFFHYKGVTEDRAACSLDQRWCLGAKIHIAATGYERVSENLQVQRLPHRVSLTF